MWAKTLLLAGALTLSLASLSGAEALRSPSPHAAPARTASLLVPVQQNLLSPQAIIGIVRSRFGGEPMGTPNLEQNGSRPVYSVRWRFPNEVVEVVRVDAISGQVFR